MDIHISNTTSHEDYAIYDNFPQHLCKMCGKCCKAITTPYSHEELVELAKKGQEEARVFIEIFKKYDSIEAARAAVPDHVDNILQIMKRNKDFDISKVTFYYCPHLTKQNTCPVYATRPDCCRRAPRNGWTIFPPDCGFAGWQFMQRERVKETIRKLKEYLLELELFDEDYVIPERNITAGELKKIINERINPWEEFGAKLW